MHHVGSWWRSDLIRLGANKSILPLGGAGDLSGKHGACWVLRIPRRSPEGTPDLFAGSGGRWFGGLGHFGLVLIIVLLIEQVLPLILCIWIANIFSLFPSLF